MAGLRFLDGDCSFFMAQGIHLDQLAAGLSPQELIILPFHAILPHDTSWMKSLKVFLGQLLLGHFPNISNHMRGIGALGIIPLKFRVNLDTW